MLSGNAIEQLLIGNAGEQLTITGWKVSDIQPTGIDLHLGDGFWEMLNPPNAEAIDPRYEETYLGQEFPAMGDPKRVFLPSRCFILGHTQERVKLPAAYAADLDGKSSLGRLGLSVHITAGFIEQGFDGNITLELYNHAPRSIVLTAGMPIGQLHLYKVDEPGSLARVYDGKYQGSEGVVPSKYWQNWDEEKRAWK